MRRSKIFLTLVLILLLVNGVFFLAWYGLGLRVKFREVVADKLGKALQGKVDITELHFSDRQLIADGVSYTAPDSSIAVDIKRIRAQYNLLRFIASGFKPSKLLRDIEIVRPVVKYSFVPKFPPRKAKKPFNIPDIAPFFSSLKLTEGYALVDVRLPVKIVSQGNLHIREEFSNISLTVINKQNSIISFTAVSARNGKLSLNGILDKGLLKDVKSELVAFRPLLISHPDLLNIQTEISTVATLNQATKGAPFIYDVKAQLWGTQLLFAGKYQVRIPFLGADTDGKNLAVQLSKSTIGSSNLQANVQISNFGKNLRVDSAAAEGGLDLAMINPGLLGAISFSANGSGTLKEPMATLKASSEMLGYKNQVLRNMVLTAEYAHDELVFKLPNVDYQNQRISLEGNFIPQSMALNTHVITKPISPNAGSYLASGELDVHAEFIDKYPLIDATLSRLSFRSGKATITGVTGYVKLVPVSADKNYYVDAKLSGDNGYSLSVLGDIMDRNLLIDATFKDLYLADIYAEKTLQKLNPITSGSIQAIMKGNNIYARTNIDIAIEEPVVYHTTLDGVGSINLDTMEASINLEGLNGVLNEQALNFSLSAAYKNKQIYVHGFKLNDYLSLSGRLNLRDLQDMDFALVLNSLSSRDIIRYYPVLDASIPEFTGLSLQADYNRDGLNSVNADLSLANVDLISVTPLAVQLGLHGSLQAINLSGEIMGNQHKLIELSGLASIKPQLNLAVEAVFDSLNLQEALLTSPVLGTLAGKAGIDIRDLKGKNMQIDITADLKATQIVVGPLKIDSVIIKAKQTPNKLQVDSLYAVSAGLFTLESSGTLNYNAVKNEFFEGTDSLHVKVDGELFPWLKNLTSYVEESRGYSALDCVISTQDDQLQLSGGNIEIRDGYIRLKDQSEPMEDISLKGLFEKNKIVIERGQFKMGGGYLEFSNVFEADNSDHFMLGYIDLGILRVMIEEPGILVNLPLFTPPKTLSNIVLKGQDSRYATVKGPFDQMKISAEVQLSNASALYPPNTANLLKLATSLRDATRKSVPELAPLPFTLDLMITLGDNVRYVTYPTHLFIEQGGFLHLLYDGQTFSVKDANFASERGTIDIFGTVFQVEKVDITMIESKDLLNVSGVFFKRAPDGSMITLTVITSPDLSKSFSERLEFALTSDNPEDRSISQVLARLRYNQTGDVANQGSKGIPLQDEALSLISGNLDSSLLTPILSPVESFIRRKLKLDGFSISAGFIQNLYSQYSTDPNLLPDYTDMGQFTTDIARFSSSILLDNLSLSMSKYLGRRLFLDYRLDLQEATDLQKKTKLLVSHETSVRYMLPKRYRLAYTFKYVPDGTGISHEIMLQRSFRYWGL